MTGARYIRSYGFFDPTKQRNNIHVFGVGSIGSFLVLNLAKMGFNKITAYDFDKIEEHNIANQFFRYKDIGSLKTKALKSLVKDFSNIDIKTRNKMITTENVGEVVSNIDIDSIIVLAFDSLTSRKIVFKALEGYPNKLIDARMGGKGIEIYVINLDNDEECKEYEESLNKETVNLPCGEQSILFTLLNVSSEISNIIVKIHNNHPYPTIFKRNLDTYTILNNQ